MNSDLYLRYERYRRWCIHILGVYPASFAIWKQIEPFLIEKRRVAVLDDLVTAEGANRDRGSLKRPAAILDDLVFAEA